MHNQEREERETVNHYLQELVRFRTVSGEHDAVLQLYDWYETHLNNPHYRSRRVTFNGFTSLIIEPKEAVNPSVIFTGHIDVVAAADELFVPQIENDRLIGRGASDMKFAAATYLHLLNTVPDIHKRGVKVILTPDEEIGGMNGVNQLVATGEFASDLVILPDDGSGDFRPLRGAKGIVWLKLSVKGQSAHGSRPWAGENALEKILRIVEQLRPHFNNYTDQDQWVNTLNLAKIESSNAINQVPESASAIVDIRFTPEHTIESIVQLVQDLAGTEVQIETLVSGCPVALDDSHPEIANLLSRIQTITGKPIEYGFDHGSSDARFLAAANIPVMMFKPLSGGEHSNKEWIDLHSLQLFTQLLKEYVQDLPLR